MPGKKSSVNPLQARKQLLIAESEINRAHLVDDGKIVLDGLRSATSKARSLGTVASIAGLIATSFLTLRKKKDNPLTTKFSWVRTAISGARAILPLWMAWRRRQGKSQ